MIHVAELTADREDAYTRFIPAEAATALYATLPFRNFLRDSVGGTPRYLVAVDGQDIVGALPLFVAEDGRWGRVINSLPWYGSHGGCLLRDQSDDATRNALLEAMAPLVADQAVAFSTVILSHAETPHAAGYRAAFGPVVTDTRDGQVTVLPENGPELAERLMQLIKQKTRNLVRKSLRQGFELSESDDDEAWQYLFDTHVENLAAIGGRAKPWSHFVNLRSAIPPAWRRLLLAQVNGRPVAALLLIRFGKTVEYMTPVISHDYRPQQPLSFLIWHGMLAAVRDGFRWWNWGGTWASQVSLHHFKAGWGAEVWPYSYVTTARRDAVASLAHHRDELSEAFPYFYLFPFDQLAS